MENVVCGGASLPGARSLKVKVQISTPTATQDAIKEDFFHGGFSERGKETERGKTETGQVEGEKDWAGLGLGRPAGPVKKMGRQHQHQHQHQQLRSRVVSNKGASGEVNTDDELGGPTKGTKRRRDQKKKRIVCVPMAASGRPTTEGHGLPSDLWAWRKYGQKPIKDSPYPRGYYRCSSSKGCSARKQVERSRTDPAMLIITYTADHNHPWPSPSRTTTSVPSRGTISSKGFEALDSDCDCDGRSSTSPAGLDAESAGEIREKKMDDDTPSKDLETSSTTTATATDGETAQYIGHVPLRDDVFGDLEELPDTHFLLDRSGIVDDQSDDGGCGPMGTEQVDPYSLFCWSGGSYVEINAVQ